MMSILIKNTFKYHLYTLIFQFTFYLLRVLKVGLDISVIFPNLNDSRILLFYLNAISGKLFATKSFHSEFQIVKKS